MRSRFLPKQHRQLLSDFSSHTAIQVRIRVNPRSHFLMRRSQCRHLSRIFFRQITENKAVSRSSFSITVILQDVFMPKP
jgi:hypothetical protein